MSRPIDVLATGRFLVATLSGARYVIDARDHDRGPTITRLTHLAATAHDRFPLANLRRDWQPIRVVAIEHVHDGALRTGVLVGEDMVMTLEPLATNAIITMRRTTPVARVEPLTDDTEIIDA